MPREKWKLTKAATDEAPEIDGWGEDLTLGFAMMRGLAESDDTLVEIAPGVWRRIAGDDGMLPHMATLDRLPRADDEDYWPNRDDDAVLSALSVLDRLFEDLHGKDGVEKLAPGVYRVEGGWV